MTLHDRPSIFDKIQFLEASRSLSKHEKLIQGILDAIDDEILAANDPLPSVNTMVKKLGYARETIVKAYKELIERGVIASKNRKGYFVISKNTKQQQKVALVMYAFDTFQEMLYQQLKADVGEEVLIDLYFHHNNVDIFEAIFHRINGHYGIYIVAPIPAEKVKELLLGIAPSKLLIIDRYLDLGKEYSYVVQEFKHSSYAIFEELKNAFSHYEEIIFYFREHTAEPREVLQSFRKFLKTNKLKGKVESRYKVGSIKKDRVYFTIHNPELYAILKDVMDKGWEPGKDLGILAHNDDVIKEILAGGITTFSTDFKKIGQLAAHFCISREKTQILLPTQLFRRKSL